MPDVRRRGRLAGMLAPIAEVHFEEKELLELGSDSLRLYPEWVRELEIDSQMSVGYRREGTLIVGVDRDDASLLQHFYDSQRLLGLKAEWLTGADARDVEPLLSPKITAAISCADDHQVDNRMMVSALISAFQKAGGTLCENAPVKKIEVQNGRAKGVWTQEKLHGADLTVLAAGCWSAEIDGNPGNHETTCSSCQRTNAGVADGGGYHATKKLSAHHEPSTTQMPISCRKPTDVSLWVRPARRWALIHNSPQGACLSYSEVHGKRCRGYMTSRYWRHGRVCGPAVGTMRQSLAKLLLKT